MNYIDIIIAVPLIYAAWSGFRKGLVLCPKGVFIGISTIPLLALLVGIYVAINFSDWTSNFIIEQFDIEGKYLPVVAFTLTFLAVGAMIYFAGKMLEKMLRLVNLSFVNKLLGLILGLIKMVYILSILIIIVETYDERGSFVKTELKEESLLYHPLKNVATFTIPAMENSKIWIKNNVSEILPKEDKLPEGREI